MKLEVKNMYLVKSGEAATKAYCNVIIGDFLISNIRLVQGKNGLFLSFPEKKMEDKRTGEVQYEAYCKVMDKKMLKDLHHLVFTTYQQKLGKQ